MKSRKRWCEGKRVKGNVRYEKQKNMDGVKLGDK